MTNDKDAAEKATREKGEELNRRETELNNQALNLQKQREELNIPNWSQKEKELEALHVIETDKMKKEIQDQYENIASL